MGGFFVDFEPIRTESFRAGESLAQVLGLVGVRPVPDALGRVNKLELIPLEELGRPRIDVVVSCSGVFRDLFINQMNLLDRAVKLAAEADEPDDQNYVRKHAKEQAKELGMSVREAATRVFSNAAGSYSANVGLAIENGGWESENQLQEQFVGRKGFAFNADKPGMMTQCVSRRPAVLRRFHFTQTLRFLESWRWVVSFPILSEFGPRRAAGPDRVRIHSNSKKKPPTSS